MLNKGTTAPLKMTKHWAFFTLFAKAKKDFSHKCGMNKHQEDIMLCDGSLWIRACVCVQCVF